MELTQAILGRRCVRNFSDYRVTDDELILILETARWAPSWKNSQVWEFIVVRDPILIEKITDTYREGNPARRCSLSASALIVACARTGISGFIDGLEKTKYANWFMFDLGMAVQNICLKAYELGLGTVIVGSLGHDRCKELLNLPEGYEVVVGIPVGRPARHVEKAPKRKELKDFIHLNQFGNPFLT